MNLDTPNLWIQVVAQQIETALAAIDGGIPHLMNQDGKRFHSEKIYQMISGSGYFCLDEEKRGLFEQLLESPLVEPLLWFEFHSYHQTTFHLVSQIVSAIWAIDTQPKQDGVGGCCIYCLKTAVKFTTQEHVYPESLGNEEAILPRGAVCDECNNLFSVLDQYLIDFPPIALLRVILVPFTKKGNFPKARFHQVKIDKIHPKIIQITNASIESVIKETGISEDGEVKFEVGLTSKHPLDGRKLGRALFKVGLGMLAFLAGPDTACLEKYTRARDFIVRDRPFNNNLIVMRRGQPTSEITTNICNCSGGGTIVVISVWGVLFLFNLEEQPRIAIPGELNDQTIILPLG